MMRVKRALYDAGVALLVRENGGVMKTLEKLEATKKQRSKKQTYDLKKKIIQLGDKSPEEYLSEIMQ